MCEAPAGLAAMASGQARVLHSLSQLAAAVLSSDGVRTGRTRSLARSLNILKWSLITAPGFSVALLPEIVSCE